jgi:hypothetical protein
MIDLEKLSLEQLIDLNRLVIRRIQYLHSLKTRSQLDQFEIGDRVGFQSEGRLVEGIVTRINRKSLSIRTKEAHWKIHPRFLTKLSEGNLGTKKFVQKNETVLPGFLQAPADFDEQKN